MLHLHSTSGGWLIEATRYTARWSAADPVRLDIAVEGDRIFRAVLVGALDRLEEAEQLTHLRTGSPRVTDDSIEFTVEADSNLWRDRRFLWHFFPHRIEHTHTARGQGRLDRCYYLGHAAPAVNGGAWVAAEELYSAQHNQAGRDVRASWEPNAVHATNDTDHRRISPLFHEFAFCPPPLFMALRRRESGVCLGVGLGVAPGEADFNGLLWSGESVRGTGHFSLEYYGYRTVDGEFTTPRLIFQPGYHPQEIMRAYVHALEAAGLATHRQYANAPWHRRPVFCGWNEQIIQARRQGKHPRELATQAEYEGYVSRLEELGLPAGTIVIDDKWMAHYGRWDVDDDKWPDLPGFIVRQHEAHRRVLLWIPCWHREGLPDEWCLREEGVDSGLGEPLQADVTHPEYREFIRERVADLVGRAGADGFKMDWIFPLPKKPGYRMHEPCWGIERLHRFQKLVYDAAHRVKPDALVQTQTPNPLFRDCSDMIRLNDLSNAMRGVVPLMRDRARIARIAGWELIDCDNASSAGLEEWRRYMQAQPTIGVPSLYCLTEMGNSGERIPEEDWPLLRRLWLDYLQGLPADSQRSF